MFLWDHGVQNSPCTQMSQKPKSPECSSVERTQRPAHSSHSPCSWPPCLQAQRLAPASPLTGQMGQQMKIRKGPEAGRAGQVQRRRRGNHCLTQHELARTHSKVSGEKDLSPRAIKTKRFRKSLLEIKGLKNYKMLLSL